MKMLLTLALLLTLPAALMPAGKPEHSPLSPENVWKRAPYYFPYIQKVPAPVEVRLPSGSLSMNQGATLTIVRPAEAGLVVRVGSSEGLAPVSALDPEAFLAHLRAHGRFQGRPLKKVTQVYISGPLEISALHQEGTARGPSHDFDRTFLAAWGLTSEVIVQDMERREALAQASVEQKNRLRGPRPLAHEDRPPSIASLAIKRAIRDPDSYQPISCSQPTHDDYQGQPAWKVYVRFRSRNGFGGYVASGATVWIQDGEAIGLHMDPQ